MLTREDIEIVQRDWRRVSPIASEATTLFYERLFELDPSLRPLFPADLSEQKKKLAAMLTVAVKGLDDLPTLVPAVQSLGRRHAGYGVSPEHYAVVGRALLWTLEKGLGGSFDERHEQAWTKVYTALSETMQSGATEAAPRQAGHPGPFARP